MVDGVTGFATTLDMGLRGVFTLALLAWNILEGAVFENVYPAPMVKLYKLPIWRLLLIVLLLTAADWCPNVAVMLAFAVFFYIMDMEVTNAKWTLSDLKRPE